MRTLRRLLLTGALLTAPVGVGGAAFVYLADTPFTLDPALPRPAPLRDRCNWACHNGTCTHTPVLPAFLTGDDGAYGWTIRGLAALGRATGIGYAGANLLIFCVAWPAVTGGLYTVAVLRRVWAR